MLRIIISSTNSAKKEAVNRFFSDQKIDFELFCFDVDSGVARTPESDEDGILGCQNRIKNTQIKFEKLEKLGKLEFEIYKTEVKKLKTIFYFNQFKSN